MQLHPPKKLKVTVEKKSKNALSEKNIDVFKSG